MTTCAAESEKCTTTQNADGTATMICPNGTTSTLGGEGEGGPYAGRPLGQCVSDADCPDVNDSMFCSRELPGGACVGCGADTPYA